MVTPDVVRDLCGNNGLSEKGPSAAGKGIQSFMFAGSNPESPSANEKPDERAGSTWAVQFIQRIKSEDHIKDRKSATALCYAILDCDSSDACEIMAVAYGYLQAGMPIAPFLGVMDEAGFWADMATRAELKAYCLACFTRLSASDQSAFLAYVQRSGAA